MREVLLRGLIVAVVVAMAMAVFAGKGADTVRTKFQVEGMHCGGCSGAIVGELERVDGVLSASADHEQGAAEAVYRPRDVTAEELKASIEKLGYTVVSMETFPADDKQT